MRIILFIILAFSIVSCKSQKITGNYNIGIYAHGDIHGRFGRQLSQVCKYIDSIKTDLDANVILVDLGDNIHGDNSTHYFNYVHEYAPAEQHIYSRIADYIGYDAIVVGNHDIETGRTILEKVKNGTSVPYLAANIVTTDSGKPLFEPYTIIDRNGIKTAIIGLTTHEVKKWLGKEKIEGIDILPAGNNIEELVEYVNQKEKPHITVLAMHGETGSPDDENYTNSGRWMARNVSGIDVVLTSHDHIPYLGKEWNGSDSVIIINSGPYGEKLSGVQINISVDDGNIVSKDISGYLVDMKNVAYDSSYLDSFKEDFMKVDAFSVQKLGYTDAPIDPSLIFDSPCVYSNLLHYVQLKESGADISFVSPTKFRGTIPAGDISYNDILALYPFENILYKVSLTGHQIKNYLELSYGNWKSKPVSYDCAGGLKYSVDFSKPMGERVTVKSFINGNEFFPDSTYTAAMASYRANGGGELLFEATGLHLGQLDGIHIEKYGAIKDLLYNHFTGSNISSAELSQVADWNITGLK